MSDIGLLMAGVLTAGQASPPKLPEQPLVKSDNVVQQSKHSETKKIVPPTQITPPEFIQPDANLENVQSALKPEHQNILKKWAGDWGLGTGDWENEDKGEFTPPLSPSPLLHSLHLPKCLKSHRCHNWTMCNPLIGQLVLYNLW